MAAETNDTPLRRAYRHFLNTKAAFDLDIAKFADNLREHDIIDQNDFDFVNAQPTRIHQLHCIFIDLLPNKPLNVPVKLIDIFRSNGSENAAAYFHALVNSGFLEQRVQKQRAEFRTLVLEGEEGDVQEVAFSKKVVIQDGVGPQETLSGGSAGSAIITPDDFKDEEFELSFSTKERPLKPSDVQLKEVIGRGSFAVVYLGIFDDRRVAVKKFRDYDKFSLAMFGAEVDIMRNLDHENIVQFIGIVHIPNERQLWLLTEFVDGGPMRRFCTPSEPNAELERSLSLIEKLNLALGCWRGLAYLHGRNCCHKDLSPDNVLISGDLRMIKITDFGLSEFKKLMTTAVTQLSGTPMYHPPEFAAEAGVLRHPIKSDVYSMGACLCELFSEHWFWNLNGVPRSQFQVMFVLIEQRRNVEGNKPTKNPDCWDYIPKIVQSVLADAIHPDYKKRQTASDLYEMTVPVLSLES